jgi:hypothetical protein
MNASLYIHKQEVDQGVAELDAAQLKPENYCDAVLLLRRKIPDLKNSCVPAPNYHSRQQSDLGQLISLLAR